MKTKSCFLIFPIAFLAVLLIMVGSCNKDENTTPTVTDIEGNVYNTVTIGTQTWMVENLKTTKYNDGSDIPMVTNGGEWADLTTPAYCWYNNDAAANKTKYGALYNWYTINTGKLCPKGWHVPSEDEWATLTTFLGNESIAGGKLKEKGTTHWRSPNIDATDEFGFTALPGGHRYHSGVFKYIDNYGYWWSSTEDNTIYAWYRLIYYSYNHVARFSYYKSNGLSVRCIKD